MFLSGLCQLEIPYKLRTLATAGKLDLARVEGLELGAMADAEQGHLRLICKQLHEPYLALGVQRGCGFVKDHDIRLVEQDAGESYPLFLAAG